MKASVIIPSYNSNVDILNCLTSVVDQKTKFPYEVIVVDSSSDGTPQLVREKFPQIHLIHLNQRAYPGVARSLGVKASKGELIVFTDTDCVVDGHWLERIISAYENGSNVIGGSVCNNTPHSPVGTAEYILQFNEFLPSRPRRKVKFIPTCNISIAKKLLKKLGDLDDYIKGSDVSLCKRIYAAGESILFDPQVKIYHKNRTNLRRFLHNQRDLGFGSGINRKRGDYHGAFFAKMPFLIPLIPIVRCLAISARVFRYDRMLFIRLLVLLPLIFIGLIGYTTGFATGIRRNFE